MLSRVDSCNPPAILLHPHKALPRAVTPCLSLGHHGALLHLYNFCYFKNVLQRDSHSMLHFEMVFFFFQTKSEKVMPLPSIQVLGVSGFFSSLSSIPPSGGPRGR